MTRPRISRLGLIWVAGSAVWIAGYLYFESLDGMMFQELGHVIPLALLPPLLPPLLMAVAVHVLAALYPP